MATVYRHAMRGWKRWVLGAALLGSVLLALTYVGLFFLVRSTRFQNWIQLEVSKRSGYEIQARDFRLVPPFRFVASAVVLSKSGRIILEGERTNLTLGFFDLFSGTLTRLELRRPILHLDVKELFQEPTQRSLDIAVRHLNIDDGTIVLTKGEGGIYDFRAITMNAENLNLGKAGSLTLSTHVPWLSASAHVHFRDHGNKKSATLRLEQSNTFESAQVLRSDRISRHALDAEFNLYSKESQDLEVVARVKLAGLRVQQESLSGEVDFRATVDSQFKKVDFEGKTLAALPPHLGPIPLQHIASPVTATLTGHYSIPEGQMTVTAFHMESVSGLADGTGTIEFQPLTRVSHARVRLRKFSLAVLKPLLPTGLRRASFDGAAEADFELSGPLAAMAIKGRTRGEATRLKNDNFSLGQLSFQAGVTWTDSALRAENVRVSGKNIALHREDHNISAREMRFEGTVEKKPSQALQASGELQLSGGGFASGDGSKVGENLGLRGRFALKIQENANVTAKGTLEVIEGEILWGRFFGNLKARRPSLAFDGDYVAASALVRMRRFSLSADNIGTLQASGTVTDLAHKPTIDAHLDSKDLQPAGFFEFFIRETVNRSYPVVDDLALGGRLSVSVTVKGEPSRLSVEGGMQLFGGIVRTKSNRWQIGTIDLVLPVSIHYPEKRSEPILSDIPTGLLSVGSARFGSESIPPLTTTVSLWNNVFQMHRPLRVPIYGGTVEISTLLWSDLIRDPHAVSLSTQVKNLQLAKLSGALGWHPFGGAVSASIPLIEWASGSLRSQGHIHADLFGGRLQISNMEIENPFSKLPAIKLDARFWDVRLEQLSETLEFGRISGILEGVVDDLVITAGQPSHFRADIHSVDRPESSQWINVEALHKLTVLSSGDDARSAFGGLATFFENFRYDKMGFKATLRNDKLTLRGVESKDNSEYLVVGSILPPTVNIISHTQEISFSELMRRLERIRKSDKPQIK